MQFSDENSQPVDDVVSAPNILIHWFLPRDAKQSAVMRLHVICPSVSPYVI